MNPNSEYFLPDHFFQQNVQALAHYLYVCRGSKEGRCLNNWLEAEEQLRENLFATDESGID